ncbi:MAG: hypothetical protein IT267_11010, partial [Saprospiraceae bacterium]|nr:hypothetical protein [Saprospiraceae bacterium]
KQSRELQRSYNEWKIDQGEISKAGVYYYQVDYRSQTKTNKMIVLE